MAVSSTDSDCGWKGARAVLVPLPRRRRRRRPHLAARAREAAAAGGGALSDAAVWRELHGGECALRRHGRPCRRALQRAERLRLGPRPAAAPAGPLHARRPALRPPLSLSSLASPSSLASLLSRLSPLSPLFSPSSPLPPSPSTLPFPRLPTLRRVLGRGTVGGEAPRPRCATSPHISPYLPISPHISPYLEALVAQHEARERTRTQLQAAGAGSRQRRGRASSLAAAGPTPHPTVRLPPASTAPLDAEHRSEQSSCHSRGHAFRCASALLGCASAVPQLCSAVLSCAQLSTAELSCIRIPRIAVLRVAARDRTPAPTSACSHCRTAPRPS